MDFSKILNLAKNYFYLMPLFWLALILLVFNITSPLKVGPAGILVVFGLLYALISSIVFLIFILFFEIIKRSKVSKKRLYYLASVISLAPISMLALNTLGQLGFIEVSLVVVLVFIACVYVVKRSDNLAQ